MYLTYRTSLFPKVLCPFTLHFAIQWPSKAVVIPSTKQSGSYASTSSCPTNLATLAYHVTTLCSDTLPALVDKSRRTQKGKTLGERKLILTTSFLSSMVILCVTSIYNFSHGPSVEVISCHYYANLKLCIVIW